MSNEDSQSVAAELVGTSPLKTHSSLRTRLERRANRFEDYFYGALFITLVLAVWFPVLGQSFVLDETGTFWAISGGAHQIVSRAIHFPQSILYCFIAWAVAALAGVGEVALRVPSVIAGVASFCLLYKVGTRLMDRTAGLLAATIWVLMPVTTYQATVARPYMLGAVAVIGSFLALLRWLDSPGTHRWIAWLLLAALPGYFSFFFILILPQQFLYLVFRRARSRIPVRQVVCAPFLIGLLELPLLIPFLKTFSDRSIHTYLSKPGPTSLVTELIPHALAYGLIAGVGLHLLLPFVVSYRRSPGECLAVAATWAAIPVTVMFAVSTLTPTSIFTSHYLMAAFPGLALYFAFLLRGFEPPSVRIAIVGITAVFAVTGFGPEPDFWHMRRYGDYRSASAFLSANKAAKELPIYAFSGFVEAKFVAFPVSDYDKSELLAPLARYPIARPVTLLPSELNSGSRAYVAQFLENVRADNRAFLLYTGNPGDVPGWFVSQVSPAFHERWLYNKSDVGVVEYTPR